MNSVSTVVLSRDCDAVQIPAGNTVTLPAGTEVDITQTLGGSYTVHAMGGLFRVGSKDSDALGITAPVPTPGAPSSGDIDEKSVWDTLRTCYDPEIPINIVELGLVYECEVRPRENGDRIVAVKMTLTAPGCGMGDVLVQDVKEKIEIIPTVAEAEVELVFDPPWNQSMMSEAARLQTGMM